MHRLDREKTIALACVLGAVCCFGGVPIFLRLLSPHVDKWTVNGVRYSFAAAFWFPWVLVLLGRHKEELRADGRNIWLDALPLAAVNLGGQVGWGAAPYFIDASTIGFTIRLTFFFAILFGFLLIPEERRLARRPLFWLGAALCLAGAAALFLPKMMAAEQGERRQSLIGIAILVGSSVCWGLYAVGVRKRLARYPVRLAFGVIALYTTAGLLVLMVLFGDASALGRIGAKLWACLIVSALLGVTFGHVLLYRAIHGLGPVVTSGLAMVQPLVTFTAAHIVLGEEMVSTALAGGMTIIAGGVLLVLAKARTDRRSFQDVEPPD